MKRTRSHQAGDIAENLVRGAFLSFGWIVNSLASDYGYDFFIQNFDKTSGSPIFALIQVKGTEKLLSFDSQERLSLRLETEQFAYWLDTPIPVYICLVEIPSQRVFAFAPKDVLGELLHAFGSSWHNATYRTVRPSLETLLDKQRSETLAAEVSSAWASVRRLWQVALAEQAVSKSRTSGVLRPPTDDNARTAAISFRRRLNNLVGATVTTEMFGLAGLVGLEESFLETHADDDTNWAE